MIESADRRICHGEPFLIRDASKTQKPLPALVAGSDVLFHEDESWQKVWLKQITAPRYEFSFATYRKMDEGIYTSRNGQYLFLRLRVLDMEAVSEYFVNFTQVTEKEAVKSLSFYEEMFSNLRRYQFVNGL